MATPNTIFLLDDNPAELEQLLGVCNPLGLSVRPLVDASDARRAALEGRPLATMVGMRTLEGTENGVRQLKAIRELGGVPVVAFGQATLEEIRRTFVAGADDHLGRPLEANWLGAKLSVLRDASRLPPSRGVERLSKTVLVADDDFFFRQRTRDVLEGAGYRVVEAASGTEVIKLLDDSKAERPDLMVIDAFMPGLGGLELVRKIREISSWASVPIVIVSGMRKDPALQAELFKLGVLDFIDKYAVTIDGVQPIVDEYLKPGGAKRRSSVRVSHFALCEFKRQPAEGWQLGFVYNLSAAGVFIRTLTPPAIGAVVDARIDLGPGSPKILTKARVAWVHEALNDGGMPCGMGLTFGELPDDARAKIHELVGVAAGPAQ